MSNITVIVPYRNDSAIDKSAFPKNTIFVDDEGKGKKYALKKGVEQATSEYVWFRDADTRLAAEQTYDLTADMYILPLKMNCVNDTLIERMQQIEYEGIQNLTIRAAQKGHAIMCSGANLIVRRERWMESYQDLHLDIPSGDDMFLLESFKQRGLKIDVLTDENLVATIDAEPNLKSLLRQRMRWAGKAPKYTDSDIKKAATVVALLNIGALLCPIIYIPKYLIERRYINRGSWTAVLLSLLYPIYMLISFFGGILRQKKW